MKVAKKLVPELRFPEFEGDWKIINFGKLAEFKNGLNFSREQVGVGIKIIGVGDFGNRMFIDDYESLSLVNVFENQKANYLLEENDIVFVRSNGNKALIGRSIFITKLTEDVTYSGFTIRARWNKEDKQIFPLF